VRLLLVRHGETIWNSQRKVQGGAVDTPLSELGLRQIGRMAEVLRDEPIDVIISSPLQRAVLTAQSIAKYHSLPIQTNPDLKEVNVGEFDGLCTLDIPVSFTEMLLDWWKGGRERLPGGESFQELQDRTWAVVRPYIENRAHENVLVVSHYFTTLSIILKAMDFPLTMLTRFRMDPGCISALEFGKFGARLARFNDISYQVV